MDENENVIEELDLEKLAEAAIEDEAANDPDPDTINVENMAVEGVED